jgi:hypothetical protein
MIFYPDRLIPGPRYIELMIQSTLFLIVIWVISFTKIDSILFSQSFIGENKINSSLFTIILFLTYKFALTYTVVDKLVICKDEKLIRIEYFLFHIAKRSIAIKFEDFSFFFRDDLLHFGGSTGIRIFNKDKFKVKLNAKNGWKKEQIEKIIQEFLIITDGKTRKRSFL